MSADLVVSPSVPEASEHPRTLGWFGTAALAMGGSNQSLFLIGALLIAQGSGAVPLLIVGLLLAWAALPGWIELVLMWPNRVGGIAATCAEAFRPYSPVLANLAGVSYWWGWIPTCGLTAIFSASALHDWYLPFVPVHLLAAAIVLGFTAINLCGVWWVVRVARPMAVLSALLALISGVVPVLAGTVDWHRALSFHLDTPFKGTLGVITSAMAGLYLIGFAAPAFEAAACHVGEMRDPARTLPRAMFAAAAMASVYFVVLPVVWLGVLGAGPLRADMLLTHALGPTFAPLLGAGAKAAAVWFMVFNMFHGTLQPLAGASRTMAQLAEDGLLPRVIGRRSRRDVPWVATALTAGFAIVFLLTGDPTWVIAGANFCYLIGIGLPSVAAWLLRRNEPERARPYRAPRGLVTLGLGAACAWGISTVLGLEQFNLTTVLFSLSLAYSGALLYALRKWQDRRAAGLPRIRGSLYAKLSGSMLAVIALDGTGYLLAVAHVPSNDPELVTVLKDIFVVVAILTVTVGLVLPGMIAHAANEVAMAADRLAVGPLRGLGRALEALSRSDHDAAVIERDLTPVRVHSRDELGAMAASFNAMQGEVMRAADALDRTREELRCTEASLARNAAQQAAIARLGRLALEGHGVQELSERVVDALAEVLEVEVTAVLESGDDDATMSLRAVRGLRPEHRSRLVDISERSPAGLALRSREPVSVVDLEGDDDSVVPEVLHEIGVRSGISVPIMARDRAIGVVAVWSRRARRFVEDETDFLSAIANVLADASERNRAEGEIRHQALHDPLTDLPNRTLCVDRLTLALAQVPRRNSVVGVLFLDLDGFKVINDNRGHRAGDGILVELAARLQQTLRPGDTVSRFGGDEFVILCEDLRDDADAIRIAERTAAMLARPFLVGDTEHFLTASLGIATTSAGAVEADELIRDADAAMYRAKERGGGRYELFDSVMRARANARMRTENELRRAIDRDELRLWYQPIISLATRRVVGVEALVRWEHPKHGLVAPAEFVPVAEETGAIIPLGRWVLSAACRQAAAWHALRPDEAPLRMSVNLSPRQVGHVGLLGMVRECLRASRLDASALQLEITESVLLDDSDSSLRTLLALKALGATLALDDFGTGYSSLAYVQRFPLDSLKVDRAFVNGMEAGGHGTIVEAIVRMAQGLRLGVVAEGVETADQAEAVTRLGCGYAQGYYFSRPVPAAGITDLLDAQLPLEPQQLARQSAG